MKSYEERIAEAIRLFQAGMKKKEICLLTGMDKKTLNLKLSLFYSRDEKDRNKQTYSTERKIELVIRHLEYGIPLNRMSVAEGIPVITLKRWCENYQLYGWAGLRDKRLKENSYQELSLREQYRRIAVETIIETMLLLYRLKHNYNKHIVETIKKQGVLLNECFCEFLMQLCRSYNSILPNNPPFVIEDDEILIYTYGRESLLKMKKTKERDAAEMFLEQQEVQYFVHEYINMLPWTYGFQS